MKKQSVLEKCNIKELLAEIDNNNYQIKNLNRIVKNYDEWLEKFKKDYNTFKQSCENLQKFAKLNIEVKSKETRDMSDFFFSREVFSLNFKKANHKDIYLEELTKTIKILMNLKESNIVFQDYMKSANESNSEIYISDYFVALEEYHSDFNSDKLMWSIPYHNEMRIDPVKQAKEMDFYRFEENVAKIIQKEHKPFRVINISKKNFYLLEIEKFTNNNRIIELILRARKKGEEKLENVGYVYVLSNEAYSNIYKIGSTYGLPEERAEELTGTGHLTSFKVVGKIKIKSAEYYEKLIHEFLNDYRVKKNREFFNLDLSLIKNCLEQVSEISEKGTKKITLAKIQKEINLNK